MPWIWKAAKRYARRRVSGAYKNYGQFNRRVSGFSRWTKRGISRPFRYADIAYRNRGGKYYYPVVGVRSKSGRTPYQGSRAQKDALYWKRKYDRMMRRVFNEPGSGARRRFPSTRSGRGPAGR